METGLPAKVLTNKRGEVEFIKSFAKAGVTDYTIACKIIGREKANFIRSAKVAFHTARLESYGFSAMETLAAGLPTLFIEEYKWWKSFQHLDVNLTTRKKASEVLLKLYHSAKPLSSGTHWVQHETATYRAWLDYL